MLDSNLISVHDMLQDVGILIERSIEQAAINMILNNTKVATYNYTAGDDSGVTILKPKQHGSQLQVIDHIKIRYVR